MKRNDNIKFVVNLGEYDVFVTKKYTRAVRISLTSKGKFTLTCPITFSGIEIVSFLHSKKAWLDEKFTAYNNAVVKFYDGKNALIFGKKYSVVILNGGKFSYKFDQTVLSITKKSTTAVLDAVTRALKGVLTDYLTVKVPLYNAVTGLYNNGFSVKNVTSIWGSCNIKTGKLTFSFKLLSKPEICTDYIIVHELCHLKERGHQKDFWALVAKFMPDYKDRERLLKAR